jgi:hypothetical protein
MNDIEPRVYRQRLTIESHWNVAVVDGETIRQYLVTLSSVLSMRIFAGPYSWPPDKWSYPEVELHELNGFVAWTESGCHVYAWRFCKFFTADIYSCKKFDAQEVVQLTADFFESADLVYREH